MDNLIQTKLVTVRRDDTIRHTIKVMNQDGVSSVLVIDATEKVCGIVTERDIVRKLAVVDIEDAVGHKISTIMSRPVEFVRLEQLAADVSRLHFANGRRHFPVLNGREPELRNVLGILTTTDLCRQYLAQLPANKSDDQPVFLYCPDTKRAGVLAKTVQGLGHPANSIDHVAKLQGVFEQAENTVILDIDGHRPDEREGILNQIDLGSSRIILITADHNWAPHLNNRFDPHRVTVMMRPIDLSYLGWVMSTQNESQPAPQIPLPTAG